MKNTTLVLPEFHLSSLRRKPQSKAQKIAQALDKIKKHSISQLGECFNQFIPSEYLRNNQKGKFSRLRLFSKSKKLTLFGSLFPPSIDEYVGKNNTVRAIDAYVEGLDMVELDFKTSKPIITSGQPAYDPKALLKLYGYLNKIHSSRRLERTCLINLEVIWLMSDLKPNYKTIANFRSDNAKALRKANKDFVLLCKELDLFRKELVAVDGTFLKASANKSSIYTENNLKKQLAKIENKIQEYQDRIDNQDKKEDKSNYTSGTDDKDLSDKLEKLKAKQKEKLALQEQLKKQRR